MKKRFGFLLIALICLPLSVHAAPWVQLSSKTSQTLYSIDRNGDLLVTSASDGLIVRSEDEGINWGFVETGSSNDLFSVAFVNTSIIVTVGQNGTILRSTDEGKKWSVISSGLDGGDQFKDFTSLIFTSSTIGYAAGEDGLIIKTLSGGSSWTQVSSPTSRDIHAIAHAGSSVWIAGDNGEVFYSGDGGDSWETQVTDTTSALQTIYFYSSSYGWAAGDNGTVLRTTNGGDTWTKISVSELYAQEQVYDISFSSSSDGVLSTDNASILVTEDGGLTWTQAETTTTMFIRSLLTASFTQAWGVGNYGMITRFDIGPPTEPDNFDVIGTDSVSKSPKPTFIWEKSTDEESAVSHYRIEVGDDAKSFSFVTEAEWPYALKNGEYSAELYAVDRAGNKSSVASLDFSVDADSVASAAPDVGKVSPTTAVRGEKLDYFVRIDGDQHIESCELFVNDVKEVDMTVEIDVAHGSLKFNANGTYNMYVRCTDDQGRKTTGGISLLTVLTGSKHAEPGNMIKTACTGDVYPNDPCTAVYYFGYDGKRHAFPNERVFKTWFDDFDDLVILSSSAMAEISLGRNVTYRPSADRLLKFTSRAVYAISYNGILRPIANGEIAKGLFGDDWISKIEGVPDVFFGNYRIGSMIRSTNSYDASDVYSFTDTIDSTF